MAVQIDYKRKLLEDIVEQCFFCENYWKGCRAFFTQDKDLEDHKQGCAFRLVHCPSIGCQKSNDYLKIQSKDWTDHLTAIHDVAAYSFVPNKPQSIRLSLKLLSCDSWFLRFKLNDKVDFFLNGKVVYDEFLLLWISMHGTCLEAKNYRYTLSNRDKDGFGITYSSRVETLDENPNDIITKKDVLIVGLEYTKKLARLEAENQGFKITLEEKPKKMTLNQVLKRLYRQFVPISGMPKGRKIWEGRVVIL